MHEIATQLRAMQLTAHAAHNMASGPTFFSDHEYLGELYGAYEAAYDSVIERMIGCGTIPGLFNLGIEAAKAQGPNDSGKAFDWLYGAEEDLRKLIDKCMAECSTGTQNLLAQLADDSEQRSYKIGQRIA